jgi:hypothetical protein
MIYDQTDAPVDLIRIQDACLKQGYCVSLDDCEMLWLLYSEFNDAGFAELPRDNEEIFPLIWPFMQTYLEFQKELDGEYAED